LAALSLTNWASEDSSASIRSFLALVGNSPGVEEEEGNKIYAQYRSVRNEAQSM
jgi:hypothetical protein